MLANYLTSFGGYQTAVLHGKGREATARSSEFRVQSSLFRVQGSEFRVQSSGFTVHGSWYSHQLVSEQLNREL